MERINVETNVSTAVVPEALSSLPETPSVQADEANGPSVRPANISQSGETRLNFVDYQLLEKLRTDALLYAKRIRVKQSFGVKHLVHILNTNRGNPTVLPKLEQWLDKIVDMGDETAIGRGTSRRRRPPCIIREGYGNGSGLRGKKRLVEKVHLQKLYDRRGLKGCASQH